MNGKAEISLNNWCKICDVHKVSWILSQAPFVKHIWDDSSWYFIVIITGAMCHTLQFIEHAAVNSNGGGGKAFRVYYQVVLIPSGKIWEVNGHF